MEEIRPQEPSTEELVARFISGDRSAFRIIVERTGAIGVGIMFGFDSDVYVDGDAACAAINMTCAISWDGNNADVGTQVACATDQGAGEWGLAQCY